MGFLSNVFKKDEDEREAAYQPSSEETQAVQAKGSGKASGKNIEKPEGGFTDAQQKRITRSRTDNNWGYYDPNTGNYVPWYIDAQDGGGKNQSGDTFEGAGLYSMILNAAGVAPYGYNRPRTYARAGMAGRPELPQPPAPTPQPSAPTPSSTPAPSGNMAINAPNPAGFSFGMPMQNTMTYRPADVPNQLGYPSGQMPPADPANYQYNTSATMQSLLDTMPAGMANTEHGRMYKNYLMTGGTSNYQQFSQGMY
jgi:hypothetical protein